MIVYSLVALGALAIGFLAGMVTFKRSLRWCPIDGSTLRCPACSGHPTPVEARTILAKRRQGRR